MHPELGSLWQWAAITLLGILLTRAASQRIDDKKFMNDESTKREKIEEKVAGQQRQIDKIEAVMGINGYGITQRLDAMNTKLDKVLNEQAEMRGAAGLHNSHKREE